jgi:signal transduction histidine kinase
MRRILQLINIFFLLISTSSFAQNNLLLKDISPFKTNELYYWADTSNSADTNQIKTIITSQKFEPTNSNYYRQGYSNATHFIALKLYNSNNKKTQFVYEIKDPSIDELELFEWKNDKLTSLGLTGDLYPFNDRQIFDKNFLYNISLNANDSCILLLRMNNHGHTNFFAIDVVEEKYFKTASVKEYLLWGIFTGILFFVAVFSILAFVSLKEKVFIYYAIYVLLITVWIWCNSGLGYQFFWGNYIQFAAKVRLMAACFMTVSLMQIMQLFILQKKENSKYFYLASVCKWTFLLLGLLLFIPYDFSKKSTLITRVSLFTDVLSLTTIIIIYGSVIEKIKQGINAAKYYLLAITMLSLGFASIFFIRLKLLPANDFTTNLIYVGILLEVLVLTYGLTIKYHQFKKDKEQLIQTLVENKLSENLKLTTAKEDERKRIAADMHDDLGAGLSGLRMMSELAAQKETNEELKNDTKQIANQAAALSDKIKDIVWTLNTENDSVQSLLFYIHQYGVRLFDEVGIQFSIQLPTIVETFYIPQEYRKNVFLSVKEAFNNILKHAKATKVFCNCIVNENLVISVVDNGIGIKENDKKVGNGLTNLKNRMNVLNGTLKIESENGTSITFNVPLIVS